MIKDVMAANAEVSANSREIDLLHKYFPSYFAEDGKFDFERFKSHLGDQITMDGYEGYELKFLGKNYARLLASMDTTTVIVPDEMHNVKPENKDSRNIYISGDNLDALKHLLKSYDNKIKFIYIDPPYNTGSDDFIYRDNFEFKPDDLADRLSIDESQAQRILDLTKRGSASHSAWMMFMYPRLQLARDLMKDDGVIFISIDENEIGDLLLMCNDIFGEENQIAQLVWQKRHGGGNDSFFVAVDHEYILVYARNASYEIHKKKWRIPYNDDYLKRYSETDENGRKYYWDTLARDGLKNPINVNIEAPDGSMITINSQKSQKTVDHEIKEGLIRIVPGNGGWMVHHRVYQPEGRVLRSILADAGTNTDSSNEIESYFGFNIFEYSKPVQLIEQLMELVPFEENDIVMDFFCGSGTTGDAVLRNNDYQKLQYIMVQLPEDLDKQYHLLKGEKKEKMGRTIQMLDSLGRPHTLDQIGIERLQRAAERIKAERAAESTMDLGFKHYTLAEPTGDVLDKLEDFRLDDNEALFVTNTVYESFGKATILMTWLVRDGYGFHAEVQEIDFAGYKGYYIEKHLYLIERQLSNESIEAITGKYESDGRFNPENVVLFGYNFTWMELDTLKINLKRLDKVKHLHINFDIRF